MDSVKRDFNTLTWDLIPVAIANNVAIGQLVILLKLPLYLDSIGTVLVGVHSGGLADDLTGFPTNFIWGFLGKVIYVPFAAMEAAIGLLATESEASRLSGLPDPIASAKALLEQGPELVVMKRGVAGYLLLSSEGT